MPLSLYDINHIKPFKHLNQHNDLAHHLLRILNGIEQIGNGIVLVHEVMPAVAEEVEDDSQDIDADALAHEDLDTSQQIAA